MRVFAFMLFMLLIGILICIFWVWEAGKPDEKGPVLVWMSMAALCCLWELYDGFRNR